MEDEIDIAELDTRIVLQTQSSGLDAMGANVDSYATIGTRWWAKVEQLAGGGESEDSGDTAAMIRMAFTVRKCTDTSGLSARDRVQFGGDNYDITEVELIPVARPRYLRLTTERRAA